VALPVLLVGTVAFRMHSIGHAPHPYIWTNTLARLDPLLVGIAIALWRHTHPAKPGWLIPAIKLAIGTAAVGTLALGLPIQSQSKDIGWEFLATAFGFGLILDSTLSLEKNPFARLLAQRPLVWLGKLTYGLYVYHVIALQLGSELVQYLLRRHIIASAKVAVSLHSLLALAITIILAAVSYRFFESFFLRLKERFSRVKSRPVEVRTRALPE
jgi:peptidoglycan/LPS O-acetylase OafA/YrhL